MKWLMRRAASLRDVNAVTGQRFLFCVLTWCLMRHGHGRHSQPQMGEPSTRLAFTPAATFNNYRC